MSVDELLQDKYIVVVLQNRLIQLCESTAEKEMKHSRYDTKVSVIACSSTRAFIQTIDCTSIVQFMEELEQGILARKATTENPGRENGGVGTYNQLLSDSKKMLERIQQHEDKSALLMEYLNYKNDKQLQFEIDSIVLSESEKESFKRIYDFSVIIASTLLAVVAVWVMLSK